MRLFERGFAECGERIETTARPAFTRRNQRILAAAAQQTHALEARQGAIERAVGGQQFRFIRFGDRFGQLVTVKFASAAASEAQRRLANGDFEGDERARLSPHRRIIRRYMRYVNACADGNLAKEETAAVSSFRSGFFF